MRQFRPLFYFLLILSAIVWVSFKLTTIESESDSDVARTERGVSVIEHELEPELLKLAEGEEFPDKIIREPHQRLLFPQPQELERASISNQRFAKAIFTSKVGGELGPLSLSKHSFSAIDLNYDTAVVQEFVDSNAEILTIPLDVENSVDIRVERILSRERGTYSFIGEVVGEEMSEVLLVFHGGAVSGSVVFQQTNDHYEFGASGDGAITVRHLDPSTYHANCGCGHDHYGVVEADILDGVIPDGLDIAPQNIVSGGSGTAATIIDTVVGYGQQARIEDGGVDEIEARILASVDRTNLAFANSNIQDIEVVLLGTIEDPVYQFPGAVTGNMGTSDELGDLQNQTDGSLDVVTDLKETLGADHATFVVEDADGSAGVAYRPGTSMITARNYMSSIGLVFAHEIGHNIGCRHAWGDSDYVATLNNRGWRFTSPNLGNRRTIMAYSSWSRIAHFSNPNVLYDGVATGVVDGYDATGDGTTDPLLVSGGYAGGGGAGFDGTNSGLGANNADYIQQTASTLAAKRSRPAVALQLEEPLGSPLENLFGQVSFTAVDLSDVIVKTFTVRNVSALTAAGLSLELEGNTNGALSLGTLGSSTLAANATTTFIVSFTAQQVETQLFSLRVISTTANVPDAVIQLFGVYDPPTPTIQVEYPVSTILESGASIIQLSATSLDDVITRTFTIRNTGELELNGLSVVFDNNTNSAFSAGAISATALAANESATVTVSFDPVESGLESVTMRILSNDPEIAEFEVNLAGSFDGPIYEESFESGFGVWTNTGANSANWRHRSNGTPTSSTGPTGSEDGDYYVYLDASYYPSSVFSIEATFDLSSYSTTALDFLYHMYGSGIGSLFVDVKVNGVWADAVWVRSGQQHASGSAAWSGGALDLSSYLGQGDVTLRFRGVLGSSSTYTKGDIAIDKISLTGDPITYSLAYAADTGGSINGVAAQEIGIGEDGVSVEAVADAEYSFIRWSDGSTTNPRTDSTVVADISVVAIFQPDTISLYNEWLIGASFPTGSTDPLSTPLNDGIPNLMRYAFNLDYTTAGAEELIPSAGVAGLPYTSITTGANSALSVEFIRRKTSIDLQYQVMFSDDLSSSSWAEDGVEQSVTSIDSDWERVIVIDSENQSTKSKRFVRVEVELIAE